MTTDAARRTGTGEESALICVPVGVRRAADLGEACARATKALGAAGVVEIRLDYLEEGELPAALRFLSDAAARGDYPLILTLRSREQGGVRDITDEENGQFLNHVRAAPGPPSDRFDVELTALETLRRRGIDPRLDWSRVICSHHDFGGVPEDLTDIYERIARATATRTGRAGVIKIAARADRITDCLPIFNLLERARRENREMIAIAMGEAGLLTRVLAPARGALLTFAALDRESASAPGQLAAEDLRELFRFGQIRRDTQITGIIGHPVTHSISPQLHNAVYAARGANAVYLPLDVTDLDAFMRRMVMPATREFDWNIRGVSVTAPHKTQVMRYLDRVDDAARAIGAVNTVVVEGDELIGYNTDAAGAVAPLAEKIPLRGARVAVLGAGGAARALLWELRRAGAHAVVLARDQEKASITAGEFGAEYRPLDAARFDDCAAIVNTTPLGTAADSYFERTPIDHAAWRNNGETRVAYDLIYNPAETRFLREARAAGAETINGLPMLVRQAVQQFKHWMGDEDGVEKVMWSAARKHFGAGR